MAVTLAWLTAQLQTVTPAVSSVPSSAQYTECIAEAIADLSQRKPITKITTLSIVSGTATYALPSDFLRVIALEGLVGESRTLVTATGLVALGEGYTEHYNVYGGNLVFTPTPAYTASRKLMYAAQHVLDDNDSYPDLSTEDARIALLKAQALALQARAYNLFATGYSYTIGDVHEDLGAPVKALESRAAELEKRYLDALKAAIGPVGRRNRGSIWYGPYEHENVE